MNHEEIISILSSWNYWGEGLDHGIERQYKGLLLELLGGVNKIVSVTGVRRAGKSYILRQVAKEASERLGENNVLYVNFEEVGFDESLDKHFLNKIYHAYLEIVKPEKKPYIILDEIQEVNGWEKFVRSIHEKNEAKIVVTGSSAKLMSEELATLLSGRDIRLEIFPLSFPEFLTFKGKEVKSKLNLLKRKTDIIRELREYLQLGGYPEVVLEENEVKKLEILKRYYDTIILKDVERRFSLRNPIKLEALARFYISNIASSITFRSVSRALDIPIKTVERYSKHLESSCMFFFLKKFSFSVKEQENSPRKIYSIDNGLITGKGFNFSKDYGKFLENFMAVELSRMGADIYYYRSVSGNEVDFIIKKGTRVIAIIQVCYDPTSGTTLEREVKSLLKASKDLKCNNLLVITWDHEEKKDVKGKNMHFVPLWKWLLDNKMKIQKCF